MNLLAFGSPGPIELGILLLLGLLLFGKRLPEVGRSIGQTVVQFKKGLNEVHDEINTTTPAPTPTPPPAAPTAQTTPRIEVDTSGYKFDPHTGEPINR
jgi:sec-independent protein translocase protein TatA